MAVGGSTRWPARCVAALVVALVGVHAAWLHAHRGGGPLDIDEAAYLTLAFQATNAGHRVVTGPIILWQNTGPLAPLVPLATVPLQLVLGRSIEVSHLVNLVFFAIVVVATYLLARRFAPAWWAVLAAVVVATAPGITDYTRHYHFAIASTAAFTVALLTLVRSHHLDRRGWSIGFGVALGAVLLARTFMLAFTPGLVLAAAVLVWRGAPDRRRAAHHLVLALAVAGVLAGSWYLFSAPEVWDYLTGYGYGADSTAYGVTSPTTLQWWLSDAVAVVSDGLYLPVTLVLGIGAVAGAVAVVRAHPRGRRLAQVLDSDALPLLIALGAAFAALLTSRNQGTGFVLPLLPAAVVLAVALTARARPRTLAAAVAIALLAIGAANVVTKAQVIPSLDDQVAWSPAPWAVLRVSSGESIIDRYLDDYDDADAGHEDQWLPANQELYHQTVEHAPAGDSDPEVLFLVEGPNLNSTTPALFSQTEDRPLFAGRNLDLTDLDDPAALAAALRQAQRPSGGSIDQLVTGPESLSWPGQGVPEPAAVAAARAAGFTPAAQVDVPGGRTVTLWVAPDHDDAP